MKTKSALLGLAAIVVATPSYAQSPGPYIQGNIAVTEQTDTNLKFQGLGTDNYDSDTGSGAGVELGYRFNDYFRTGLEGAYRYNHVHDQSGGAELQSAAAMANAYIDFPTNTPITPYIGGGVGYSYVNFSDLSGSGGSKSDSVLAYQGMAGLSYAASPDTDVVLGYKYFGTSTPEFNAANTNINVKAPYSVHNVELGLRYKF